MGSEPLYLRRTSPKFVLGFVMLMVLGSAGAFSSTGTPVLGGTSEWSFLVASAGPGLGIDLRELRGRGVEPVSVVLTNRLPVSTLVLLVLLMLL